MLRRLSYSYRRKPSTVRRLSGKTIKNRGLPGRGPYTLPPLTPGKLYGYTVSAPKSARRRSLKIAAHHDSPLTVFRRLRVLAQYLKRTSPKAAFTILSNAAWINPRRKY